MPTVTINARAPHFINGEAVRVDPTENGPIEFHEERWVRLVSRSGNAWEFSLTSGKLIPLQGGLI